MPKIPIDISKGWMVDLPRDEIAAQGGLYTAKNVIPFNWSYYPMPGKATYNTTAISGTPLQGTYVQASDGTYYNFIGTVTKLYRFTKSAMTDITKSATTYTGLSWDFASYGNWLVATNGTQKPQVLKGVSSASSVVDLGGLPGATSFTAKYALVVNEHLVFANLTIDGTAYPKDVIWSARSNVESWPTALGTPNLATGADSQSFPDMLGTITGISSIGNKWAIFSEQSIALGEYIGGTYTMAFNHNFVKNTGCFYPASLFSISVVINATPVNSTFFWSQDSLWMLTDSGAREIGQNVKSSVFANINQSHIGRIGKAHWPQYGCIVWAYPDGSSSGNPNKLLIYNYREDRMTHADLDCSSLFTAVTGGVDADTYTSPVGDEVVIPGDSSYWVGKNINPLVIDTDSKAKDFTGTNLAAEIETGELVEEPLVNCILKAYMPIDGSVTSSTVRVKHRYSSLDGQTISSSSSIKSDSSVDLRTTNKRLALNIQLNFSGKFGRKIEADIENVGRR